MPRTPPPPPQDLNQQERYKTHFKLQRQSANLIKKKLIALWKDAGVWKSDYEETMDQKCELCKVYTKTQSKQIVSLPMARKFIEKVAMDLKQ